MLSEATRLKLSANNPKSIAVILRNTDTDVTYKFFSMYKAAQFLGVIQPTNHAYIKQERACKGYIISFV